MIRVFFIISVFMFTSCRAQQEKEIINESVQKLGELIVYPEVPIKSSWVKIKQGKNNRDISSPVDYHLICVLSYESSQIIELKKNLEGLEDISSTKYLEGDFVREWFPSSVKEKFYKEGNYLRIKSVVYNAKAFSKNPFYNGYYFITEDNKIFIFMYTT